MALQQQPQANLVVASDTDRQLPETAQIRAIYLQSSKPLRQACVIVTRL